MENGVKQQTGMSTLEIAAEGGVSQIGALPAIPVILKALGAVVQVINKIASIFKKNKAEAGPVDETTMSDLSLFEEEERLQRQSNSSASGGGGGGSAGLLAAGAAALAIFAL